MARQIDGLSLGLVAAGGLLGYAGIKGYSIPHALQAFVAGKVPTGQPDHPIASVVTANNTMAAGGKPAAAGTSKHSPQANQALGRVLAAAYGWTGAQFTALNNIAMAESGWQDEVTNPGSGAAGIAQNIRGWGPGYQQGNARQQIEWMLSYIKSRYGTPAAAWQFHLQNGWY